ncbi:T6SS immunity protein Tli4 family protein [Massilia glaciei]|uniref:T6SS immunity protein Tli4 family protein n=1 Tax=Massilia glaciei TaxID=1524097 RepID=UPI0011B26879|nr:T6SS immunity protein Tli4 family protein [Massilia glaciei]
MLIKLSRNRKLAPVIMVLLFGCGRSQGQPSGEDNSRNSAEKPTTADFMAITAPTYRNTSGRQECLGRLVFGVDGKIQWPTFYAGNGNKFARSFSAKVFNSGDVMQLGTNEIAVFFAPNAESKEVVKFDLPSLALKRYEQLLFEAKDFLKKEQNRKFPSENYISNLNNRIENWTKTIIEAKNEYFSFDPGVPGGEGFGYTIADGASRVDNYSVYRAYITRGNYIYTFESSKEIVGEYSKEIHAQEFSEFLKNFRPREENEIPSELGVCIPHGFIRDDGKTLSDIKQSFRMPDAPGVLYTIHTGSYENSRGSPVLNSISFASVGGMGTAEDEQVKPFITERIGPKSYKIGGVSGLQGGVAAKITEAGKAPYETYQVFTGYSGWPSAEALPFIFVELNTTTMNMAPELKQNPPPFKQSMGRYEALLKSIRLRPTSPPMPDMAGIVGK